MLLWRRTRGSASSRLNTFWWWVPLIYALAAGYHERGTDPFGPDANGYLRMAADFHPSMWLGGIREPVWPTLAAFPVWLMGDEPRVLQVVGILAFAAMVLASQYVARTVLGYRASIAVGFVLAASPWLARQAATGLREEFAAALTLATTLALVTLKPGWRGPILIGALAGIAAMSRWDTVLLTVPVAVVAFYRVRVPWRAALAAGAIAAGIVLPFLIGNAIDYDDPLHHSNIHAVFFRNMEFGATGEDGLPTPRELVVSSYAGSPETWTHYLFKRHDLSWVVDRTARGTVNTALSGWSLVIFEQPLAIEFPSLGLLRAPPVFLPWFLLAISAVGAWSLWRRGYWQIPTMTLLSLLQHAPIAHLMDPRLGLTAVPFLVICAGAGIGFVLSRGALRVLPEDSR